MGDPRRLRKKYSTPGHPWVKSRIDKEKELATEYGFKNKREIWRIYTRLSKIKKEAKKIIATQDKELAKREEEALINKLRAYNLLGDNAKVEDVLAIEPKDLMERLLQTIVYRKGLARSIKQARQMIVHRHIMVNNKVITSPSYMVSVEEEATVSYSPKSPFNNPNHPEVMKILEKSKEEQEKQETKEEVKDEESKEESEEKADKEIMERAKEQTQPTNKLAQSMAQSSS